jgi:hypothetical protein
MPLPWEVQVEPPSEVYMTSPSLPTAHPSSKLAKLLQSQVGGRGRTFSLVSTPKVKLQSRGYGLRAQLRGIESRGGFRQKAEGNADTQP